MIRQQFAAISPETISRRDAIKFRPDRMIGVAPASQTSKSQNVQEFLCNLLKMSPFSSLDIGKIRPSDEHAGKVPALPKNAVGKNGIITDFLSSVLNCITPGPEPNYCVDNGDCDQSRGERCKQGQCVVDVSHCAVTGCSTGYTCNDITGNCDFVPNCQSHDDCDVLGNGELCINNLCQVPSLCTNSIGGTGGCAPGWACVDSKCVQEDCSVVDLHNNKTCCDADIAFNANKSACCAYVPSDPRCLP